ncbi:MAG: DUF3549 family protein [Candidatus Thiodiazotropha sp. (ex Dulcina madagascariensis)]|nr:DUF3549 family protein [Candidatus Thiodiazotropha sp. (ex Dulcina madagascariensis)]
MEAICHCLENEAIPVNIAQALADRAMRTLEQPSADPQVLTALVRGISQSASPAIRDDLILRLLEHPVSSRTDILAAIAGRAWECLTDASLRGRYLERLAVNESGQDFFNRILSDLLFLPITRVPLQAGLREPQRSAVLSNAIGEFFTAAREA